MDNKPISIQNVQGNVTVTIVEGNNNITKLNIDAFTKRFAQDCGLRFIYNDCFKQNTDTSTDFQDWLKGFQFNIKSIYHGREYRRENLLKDIKAKLEEKQRLLLLGESGTSKSVILIEIMCDYLKEGYKILHNLESGSMESSSSEIKNLEFIEDTLLALVESREKILVIVDNVHNKTISNIFYLIKKIRDDHEDKLDKIRFLLSARQPDFELAMTGRGIFDSETKNRIDLLFDNTTREPISYFTQKEVKGFIEKYRADWDLPLRNKSVEENAQAIFEDTKGYPIMVRFSVLKNKLKNHVRQMYQDWLLTKDDSPNIERIKSVIACSLYHISSIPLSDKALSVDLNLEDPSYELNKTIIKIEGNIWTTIHPRWDLELFNYLFSLNAHIRKIQRAFSFILNKILDINSGTWNQVLILNTVYNTIAAEKFVDIKIIKEMIKEDDIEKKIEFVDIKTIQAMIKEDDIKKKIDNSFFKVLFFAGIIGNAFNKLEDYNYAIICYDKAIEINPQFTLAYFNKGNALYALGRKEEAIVWYDKAIEIDPQNADAYNNKGLALSALGRKEEAIVLYDKAIEINPQYADVYYNKGISLAALSRKEEAIVLYDKAIEINPQYAESYINKGNALLALGRKEEAIVLYDKAIEINPQYAESYINKGNALSALGRNEEAIVWYDKTIEIDPQYADAYYNKGNALSNLGRKEEAIVLYDKAIEINPQNADAYNNKGLALSALGRKEEAIVCFDKAIEINPQYFLAYLNKGTALSSLGKKEEAIACYDKTLEINPQDAMAYYNKGNALLALGRKEEAIVLYDKAIEINPQFTLAYFNKGNALYALGRKEEAIVWYDKAIEIDPQNADAYNNKGLALSALGRKEEALDCFSIVLEYHPKNLIGLLGKAYSLIQLNRKGEAKSLIDKILSKDPNNEYALNLKKMIE